MISYSKNIIWIVSYPKSGNTWVRIFLQKVFEYNNDDITLPDYNFDIASNRKMLDSLIGIDSSDLSDDEILRIRPKAYRILSLQSEHPKVIKVHDAFSYVDKIEPLFPQEITKAVIYIIRNPLDVTVSFAYHMNISFEKALTYLNKSDNKLVKNEGQLNSQVTQHLGTWSEHVKSWTTQNVLPLIIVRYEDLLKTPEEEFTRLLDRLGLRVKNHIFKRIMKETAFAYLKEMENRDGFNEKPIFSPAFFREGKANNYMKYLSKKQIYRIINVHHEMMTDYGYSTKML